MPDIHAFMVSHVALQWRSPWPGSTELPLPSAPLASLTLFRPRCLVVPVCPQGSYARVTVLGFPGSSCNRTSFIAILIFRSKVHF